MPIRPARVFGTLCVSLVLISCPLLGQQPDEFRVETDVFVEDSEDPTSQTLTLFSGEMIYDFLLTQPEEVTILDLRRSKLTLLDKKRQVKTTLKTDELQQVIAALKVYGASKQRDFFDPDLAVEFDEDSSELLLTGEVLTYRALGLRPKHTPAARQYREFADWYARLNAVRRGLPPFARIKLNRSLSDRGLLPREVWRTVITKQKLVNRKSTAHSTHDFVWGLSNSDRKRIENAGTYQAMFKAVPLNEYWQIGQKR